MDGSVETGSKSLAALPHFPLCGTPRVDYALARDAPMKRDLPALESWLREAARIVRGPVDTANREPEKVLKKAGLA